MEFKLRKISGDASFRQFYRLTKGKKTSIIIESKKEKFKNLIIYAAINKFLRQKDILAPKLIKEFFHRGIIEIEDFGNISFFQYLDKKKNKYEDYTKIINLLLKIQKIKIKKLICSIKKHKIKLKRYDSKHLHEESDLFFNWYLVGLIGNKKAKKYKILIKKELKKIYEKIYFKNAYFVHRDFHVSNFMLVGKRIGIIDSQDAIIGNPAYDLVSLIDDVRIKTSLALKKKIFKFYLKKSPKIFRERVKEFRNDFNILSIQRNLKILGIFYRLFKRDKKIRYLKFIPYTWKLIELRLKDSTFKNLKLLLNKAINKKLRRQTIFK